jgi:hypothetical protein
MLSYPSSFVGTGCKNIPSYINNKKELKAKLTIDPDKKFAFYLNEYMSPKGVRKNNVLMHKSI